MLGSTVCRYEHFETDWYARWAAIFGVAAPPSRIVYRKNWEWCAVAQALDERDMLRPGRSGLGFAVGHEYLPSAFAARGCAITATDVEDGTFWQGQHADGRDAVFHEHLVGRETFERLVKFQFADMRDLKGIEAESYDFLWSSCAFEHLGSLDAGIDFVIDAMRLLKPGGIAVHTTEYNVSSNDKTLTTGDSVIYRRRDIEDLDRRLRSIKCGLERLDFFAGTHPFDLAYDEPPHRGDQHLKLLLGDHVATSILLIAHRSHDPLVVKPEQRTVLQRIGRRLFGA